jgi:hypothetical protein
MLKPFIYYGSQLVSIKYPSSIMGILKIKQNPSLVITLRKISQP